MIFFQILVAQNLQNIIFNQIKAAQMGSELQEFNDCKLLKCLIILLTCSITEFYYKY